MGTTYIVAIFCPKCKTYNKVICRGACDNCSVCNSERTLEMVEKWGKNDPNVREEVTNICYGENPRYSMTLGVTETQIKQATKLHPGTDWKRFGKSFRPLIRNRGHKIQVMKEAGYAEFDTKQFKGRQS